MPVRSLFPVRSTSSICLSRQKGVGMIEVLVSVLVMSVGLVGLAGLQISTVNNATVSYTNTQAIFALQDIAGLLLSSAPAAKAGEFNIALNPNNSLKSLSALTTPTGSSSPIEKARYYWLQNLSDVLPNAKAFVDCDAVGNCTITVQFSDVDKNTNTATHEQTVIVKV